MLKNFNNEDEIKLYLSYDFSVKVKVDEKIFSGKLTLTPEEILLVISGDEIGDRRFPDSFYKFEYLQCSSHRKNFYLIGLIFINFSHQNLQNYPSKINHFEVKYRVEKLIIFPKNFDPNSSYSVKIYSSILNQWVGPTETQRAILSNKNIYDAKTSLNEFQINNNNWELSLAYELSEHYSLEAFSSGFSFPPFLYFSAQGDITSFLKYYEELISFMIFITNHQFTIDRIKIYDENLRLISPGYLYYPTSKITRNNKVVLFPLNINPLYGRKYLPKLPLEIFNTYFSLEEVYKELFNKYISYKNMENIEERFLGFFRILEKLSFKKKQYVNPDKLKKLIKRSKPFLHNYFDNTRDVNSFLGNFDRFNSSKYNTQKCQIDLLDSISKKLTTSWKIKRDNIIDLCTLRNDITHANFYSKDKDRIVNMTSFVEVLLIFSLLKKLGVKTDDIEQILPRLDNYWQLH